MSIQAAIEKWEKETRVEDFPNIEVPDYFIKNRSFGKVRNEYIYNLVLYNPEITLQQIADVFGMGRERVRQILEDKGYRKSEYIKEFRRQRALKAPDEEIFKLARENREMSWKEIADHFGVDETYVRSRQYEVNVDIPKRIYRQEGTVEKYEEIMDYINKHEDITYEEVANALDVAVGTVQNATEEFGYRRRDKRVVVKEWQREAILILLYCTTITYDDIAKFLGLTRFVVASTKSEYFKGDATRQEFGMTAAAHRFIRDFTKLLIEKGLVINDLSKPEFESLVNEMTNNNFKSQYENLTKKFIDLLYDNKLQFPQDLLQNTSMIMNIFNKYFTPKPDIDTFAKNFFKDMKDSDLVINNNLTNAFYEIFEDLAVLFDPETFMIVHQNEYKFINEFVTFF